MAGYFLSMNVLQITILWFHILFLGLRMGYLHDLRKHFRDDYRSPSTSGAKSGLQQRTIGQRDVVGQRPIGPRHFDQLLPVLDVDFAAGSDPESKV
jgi:hypothetical protein